MACEVASHADVLRGSSRVPAARTGMRDEPLRTSAWEATCNVDETVCGCKLGRGFLDGTCCVVR